MKTYASIILMITICTLTFQSCSKKKDDTPPPINYGTVVFWTKNAAKLAACSNNISIRVSGSTPLGGGYYQGTASITFLSPFEPSDCRGNQSVPNLIPGMSLFSGYNYTVNACSAGGTASPLIHFTVSDGECLKIEIP